MRQQRVELESENSVVRLHELHRRTVEALTAVAVATTPWATFRAITQAKQLLGEQAEHYWPLIECMAQRQGEMDHLRRLAGMDELTGVSNRRAFHDSLERELARRARTGENLAVVVVDMDDLKLRNDSMGHACGDEALRALAKICVQQVRTTDVVARLGGDEFALLLVDSDDAGTAAFIARLRDTIECSQVAGRALRASIGYAVASDALHTGNELLAAADRAMYLDKEQRKRRTLMPPQRDGGTVWERASG